MKKILFIMLALFAFVARADNVITSKEYVDTQVGNLQEQLPAKNTDTVLTYSGTAGTVGKKKIYDSSAAYSGQNDALVTAGAFNTAIQNALETEFVCIDRLGDVHDNAHCLLYKIHTPSTTTALPNGFTELEYLESRGSAWIDTSVTANASIVVDLRTMMELSKATANVVIGTRNSTNTDDNNIFQFGFFNSPTIFFNRYGLGPTTGDSYNVNTWYDVHLENHNCVIKSDTEYFSHDYKFRPTMNTGGTLYLFATNDLRQGAVFRLWGRIAYCKIQKDGALVRNFVPARRDSDGELGMYDLVSNTFFTKNIGSDRFYAGPEAHTYLPQGQ